MKKIVMTTLAACALSAVSACSFSASIGDAKKVETSSSPSVTASQTPTSSQGTAKEFTQGSVSVDDFVTTVTEASSKLTTWKSRMALNSYSQTSDSVKSTVIDFTVDNTVPENRKLHIVASTGETLVVNKTLYRKNGSTWTPIQNNIDLARYTTSFVDQLHVKKPAIKTVTYKGTNDKGLKIFVATIDVPQLLRLTQAEGVPDIAYDDADVIMHFDNDMRLVYQELTVTANGKKIDSTTLEQSNFNQPVSIPTP